MNNLGKKVGYLKGLMEGMDFSENPSYGKLFGAMADLLNEISDRLETAEELIDDLNDYVESIDDDLSALEGESDGGFDFNGDDDDDFSFDEDDDDDEDQLRLLNRKAKPAEEPEPLAGAVCPECSRMFFVSMDDAENAQYDCPHCGKRVTPAPLTPENAPIAKPAKD